jgi:hypothetical protein
MSHWQLGRFDLYRVNPPLVRLVAALPVVALGPKTHWHAYGNGRRERAEWLFASEFVKSNRETSFWYVTLARWACIPFSLCGAWISFRWARELYGSAAGLLAATLWCSSPNILANAQMITPDTGAAALSVASAYAFWQWLKEPGWDRALVAGAAMGIAELIKTTLIVFFALYPALWLFWRQWGRQQCGGRGLAARAPGFCRIQAAQLATILGLSVYIVNVGYGFEDSFERLGDLPFASAALTGSADDSVAAERVNRFADTCLRCLPVLFPKNYVLGIDQQRREFEIKYWSYLAGEWRFGGWWYYYLYALAIKVPLGIWALLALAIAASATVRGYSAAWRDEMILLMPIAVVLALVGSQTGFSRHMRYVLPIFPFAFIWISKVARSVDLGHGCAACLASVALAWSVSSSLWIYPHSLSYFNETVGGPMGGHAHLLDSNIDWGQDLLYLKRWLKEHPEAEPIGLAYSLPAWLLDPKDVGVKYTLPPPGPQAAPGDWPIAAGETGPLPGWYAVFVGRLRDRDAQYAYFSRFKPVATGGYSVYIYHISSEEANRVRAELGLEPLPVSHRGGNLYMGRCAATVGKEAMRGTGYPQT